MIDNAAALRLVHEENYGIMWTRNNRAGRVDALSVDRSRVRDLVPRAWSHEALAAGEQTRSNDRARVTHSERIDAWRGLFKLTRAKMR